MKLLISNLKRQVTARRPVAAEAALQRCLALSYNFECERHEPSSGRGNPVYLLTCRGEGNFGVIGAFVWEGVSSRPHFTLLSIWKRSGAGRPWEDEQ